MSRETIPMSEDEAIAIVRNPWGHREDDVRRARLRVCARMEAWRDAYHNMRQFAIDEGLDVTAHVYAEAGDEV